MSRKRERRRKRLENSVAKKRAAYDKLSKGGIVKRTKTKAKTLANKELYIKFERKKVLVNGRRDMYNMNAPTKYKTLPSIRVRDRKHTGHGVLNMAARKFDRFEGDVPSLTRKLKDSQPKTRRGKAAKTVLLASAGTLKKAGKYALAAENAVVNTTYKATKKTVTKAAGAAVGAVKNKLHSKAEESLGGYSFYLKAAGALPTAKEIKQYIRQKNIYRLESSKSKLLKAESKVGRLETKQAKKELRQARKKYREKTGVVSYYLNDNSDNIRNSQSHKDNTQKLTSAKKELRTAKKELRQAKKLGKSANIATPMSAAGFQKNVRNGSRIKQGKADTIRSGDGKPLLETNGKTRLEKVSLTAKDKSKLVNSENTRLDKASKAVREKKAKVRELKYDRKANIKQKKREARFDKLEKKAEYKAKRSASNGVLAGKKREYTLQKKIAKYEKPKSIIGGKVKQLASSAKSRLINADPDNSTLQAAGKLIDVTSKASGAAVGAYKLLNRAEIQAAAKLRGKAQQINQSKLHANKQRLDRQRAANRKPPSYKNRPKPKETVTKKVKEFFKNVAASAGGAGAKVLAAGVPIVLVALFSAMLIYLLMSSVAGMFESGIVWTMGTYPADDFSLGRAEKEYTRIAKEFNRNIIKVGNKNTWKNTLSDKFGADKSKLKSTPENWYWGNSSKYDWDPEYDFDPYKLWAFMCAYYAEFNDEGEPKITKWEYTDDTASMLQNLFDAEYEFVYTYDDNGYWEELDDYEFQDDGEGENYFLYNDGCADRYAYTDHFDIDGEWWFSDGHTVYFDSDYEILNANDLDEDGNMKRTGYYLVNQFDSNCDRCFYADRDSEVCNSNENYPYLVSGRDLNWDAGEDTWGWMFFKKNEWIEDTALYYNVKQKKSFEDAIKDKLKVMPNGDDRVSIYEMYMGEDGAPDIHGGHQSYANILPGDSFYEDYIETGKVVTGFGWSMSEWNENNHIYEEKDWEHKGIDILVDKDTEVYAAIDGKITWLNADRGIIRIRTDGFRYFYEAGESDEDVDGRDTEVIYYNVSAVDTLSYGDTVKAGELIGYTNGATICDRNKDNSSYISDPYLHLQVNIDKDGFGWEYVDPRPLIP